jgi:serine/threonine protein phosphatase PrpC
MINIEQTNSFTPVQIKKKTIQLCNAQDYAYKGTNVNPHTGETYHYGIIIDGHGSDEIVNNISDILNDHMIEILNSETPHLEIQNRLEIIYQEKIEYAKDTMFYKRTLQYLEQSAYCGGSTFLVVKLYENRIEIFSVGDSEVYIMINNEIVYHNPTHKWSNESEMERLSNRDDVDIIAKYQSVPHIISPERTGFAKSACVEYYNKNSGRLITTLAPTQALGHNSITHFAPEQKTIPVEPTDTIKIVLASDGLWDVFVPDHPDDKTRLLEMDGEQLADLAESRWKQEWEVAVDYSTPDVLYNEKSRYPSNSYDDIAVITMIRNPL